jgi:hypothetical protein
MSKAQSDVYAGDTETTNLVEAQQPQSYIFTVTADAEPNVFGLIANLFNIANLAPRYATLETQPDELVVVTVRIGPISPTLGDMIGRKLLQLTCVISVVAKPCPSVTTV